MAIEIASKSKAAPAATNPETTVPRDTTREIFETVVFVVVLVLLLKLFVAEAFVIPTGSMAPTLYGDQFICTCRECGHAFPINASYEGRRIERLSSYLCENCGYHCEVQAHVDEDISSASSGDRVLVMKYAYHLRDPRRFDVPVFKYPVEPFKVAEIESKDLNHEIHYDMQGMNFIKRLVGLGGETIAVFAGDLYNTKKLSYSHIPPERQPLDPLYAWKFEYMYPNDPEALAAFHQGQFEIIRKSPEEILAVRRIVFDLDKQPKSLQGNARVRWQVDNNEGTGWMMNQAGFKHAGTELGYVLYQHLDPWSNITVENQKQKNKEADPRHLIIDNLGYNNPPPVQGHSHIYDDPFPYSTTLDSWARQFELNKNQVNEHMISFPIDRWVPDLVVDCKVEINSPEAEIILELNKGNQRCQAIFNNGICKLVRHVTDDSGEKTIAMGSHPTKITKSGRYRLRLANVDCRLTVWVDNKAIAFSPEESDYLPPPPTQLLIPTENDFIQPARIGARGDVTVTRVSLWRDLLYNCAWINRGGVDDRLHKLEPRGRDLPNCGPVQTYYVQPGHFLMFGDNTNSSKDSRSWGLVPERLMLGRAMMVYWPLSRLGVIE